MAVRQLTTRGWLLTHALALGMVVLFLVLGWWQLHRAESGNTRSFAYVFEWPTFALLVVGFWMKIVHDELHPDVDPGSGRAPADEPVVGIVATAAPADEDAAELAAYNRYLADRARRDGH